MLTFVVEDCGFTKGQTKTLPEITAAAEERTKAPHPLNADPTLAGKSYELNF